MNESLIFSNDPRPAGHSERFTSITSPHGSPRFTVTLRAPDNSLKNCRFQNNPRALGGGDEKTESMSTSYLFVHGIFLGCKHNGIVELIPCVLARNAVAECILQIALHEFRSSYTLGIQVRRR